ncbi:MAG: hypothetical protein B6I19_11655 [Bacteroidetes bacterium 4572_114]|nr:MAG: hypothetical protein B6I19_11655 [Bacteroidetes bacterium 4572_114]
MAAGSGDTVLVWPGTYYENILLERLYNDITIASRYLTTQDECYIHNTIIDGFQNGSCIAIRNTELAEIMICGFTIQNGSGYGTSQKRGGGIFAFHANPVIRNCIVQNNQAEFGGGIYSRYSVTYLSGSTIRYNHSFIGGGGLLCSYDASIIFDQQNKCNLYFNYSPYGSEYSKTSYSPAQEIILDTFTILNPDQHFVYSNDVYNYPVNDLTIEINNAKIVPVNYDLYVDPVMGSNSNDGITLGTALKTIAYAYHIIASDSLDPHCIYLSNGIYSPSTNGELFPLNGRSYVSLIGTNRDSTIFNADSFYYFFKAYGLMTDISIENITFINGFGFVYTTSFSGLVFDICNIVYLKDLYIHNCISSLNPAIFCTKRVGISGSLPETGMLSGKITNLQITDNLRVPDPFWGPGMAGGLIVSNHATVDLVNATIGRNVVRGEQGYAVNVSEGSELNIYNSILFGDSLSELSLGNSSGSGFPATANIAYSNIEGGEDEIMNWYNQHTLNWLDGNMDEGPRWAGTGDTAYYLLNDSPCINAGTPMYEEGMDYPYIKMEDGKIVLYKYDGDTIHLPATDLAGNPRISGGRIDMGAYEYQDTSTAINEFTGKTKNDNKVLVYPNPFTAHTFITFRIQNKTNVLVKISDIKGRTVKTLMDANIPKGEYSMTWEGTDDYGNVIKNGTYITTFYLNGIPVETVKIIKKGFRKY